MSKINIKDMSYIIQPNKTYKLLVKIGANPATSGFDYLIDGIIEYARRYANDDIKGFVDLYQSIGNMHSTSYTAVERAMRYQIQYIFDKAAESDTDSECRKILTDIFADIDARPNVSFFIASVAKYFI